MAWGATPSVAAGLLCVASLGGACLAIRSVYGDEEGNGFLTAVLEVGVLTAIAFGVGWILLG